MSGANERLIDTEMIASDDNVYINKNIIRDMNVIGIDYDAFMIFLDILFCCDRTKNMVYKSFQELSFKYKKSDKEMKMELFNLRDNGFIEIYKSHIKGRIAIAPRKNEYISFDGSEFYLDPSSIIFTPNLNRRCERGYAKFRKNVLDRDNHTCRICGGTDDLEVHHIKSYAKHPKLRTCVNNGVTLCKSCHKHIHKSGGDFEWL